MLANAARICEAKFGMLYLREGDAFRAVAAIHDAPPAYVEKREARPRDPPPPDAHLGRVRRTKRVVHIADLRKLQSYLERHPFAVAAVELGGFRTVARGADAEGQRTGRRDYYLRQEVRPFTDKQIELVKNFAAQAVIAIENTRLLNELRQRTDDYRSAGATDRDFRSTKVISGSPGELKPVFDTMLANATRICDAKFGNLFSIRRRYSERVAMHGAPRAIPASAS